MHTVYTKTDRQQIVYSERIGRRDVLKSVILLPNQPSSSTFLHQYEESNSQHLVEERSSRPASAKRRIVCVFSPLVLARPGRFTGLKKRSSLVISSLPLSVHRDRPSAESFIASWYLQPYHAVRYGQ